MRGEGRVGDGCGWVVGGVNSSSDDIDSSVVISPSVVESFLYAYTYKNVYPALTM